MEAFCGIGMTNPGQCSRVGAVYHFQPAGRVTPLAGGVVGAALVAGAVLGGGWLGDAEAEAEGAAVVAVAAGAVVALPPALGLPPPVNAWVASMTTRTSTTRRT